MRMQSRSEWGVAEVPALALLILAVLSGCASSTPAAPPTPVSAGKPTFIFFYRDA